MNSDCEREGGNICRHCRARSIVLFSGIGSACESRPRTRHEAIPDDSVTCTRNTAELSEPSGRLLAVDEPWNAKSINENAETKRPKCFLQRHLNSSVFCQRLEDALGFHWITEIEL